MKVLIALIIVLAACLRILGLGQFPQGITADEIQQGYAGYSILKTGMDEWGDWLPLSPRGFGDYKPPLYSYLTIPFELFWGLNITAVRLPSALAGVMTVLVVFFLAKELLGNPKVGILAAFLLAISPWHIYYSRFGFEANIGVLLFSLGLLFLIKSFKKNNFLVLAALFFGLTLFTYHSFKLFTILFLVGFILLYYKDLFAFRARIKILSGALLSIFLLVTVWGFLFAGAGRRAADAAIYSPEGISSLRSIQVADRLPDPFRRIVNNKWQYLASKFAENYLGYYSLNFFFSPHRSDATVFNLPGQGLLYIWEAGLLIVGIYWLIRNRLKWSGVLFLWLMLAPIPAALTRDYMHAQRVATFLPLLPLFSAFTLAIFLTKLTKPEFKLLFTSFFIIISFWSLIGRTDYYLFHAFNRNLGGLKYGYQEVVEYLEQNQQKYDQIIFTKVHSEPHMFLAFYSRMDPYDLQAYSKNWKYFEKSGFKFLDMINYQMGKYHFRDITWHQDKNLKNALIVASPSELPPEVNPKIIVKDHLNKPLFLLVETNEI